MGGNPELVAEDISTFPSSLCLRSLRVASSLSRAQAGDALALTALKSAVRSRAVKPPQLCFSGWGWGGAPLSVSLLLSLSLPVNLDNGSFLSTHSLRLLGGGEQCWHCSVLSRRTVPPFVSSGAAAGTRAVAQTASRWLRFGAPPSVQSFTCRLLTSEQREANVREKERESSSSAPRGEAGKCILTEKQGRRQKKS